MGRCIRGVALVAWRFSAHGARAANDEKRQALAPSYDEAVQRFIDQCLQAYEEPVNGEKPGPATTIEK